MQIITKEYADHIAKKIVETSSHRHLSDVYEEYISPLTSVMAGITSPSGDDESLCPQVVRLLRLSQEHSALITPAKGATP